MFQIILWIAVGLNLFACVLNMIGFKRYMKKLDEYYKKLQYIDRAITEIQNNYVFIAENSYEAENGRRYIDLEGGLRLVIFEGKIEGWYIP